MGGDTNNPVWSPDQKSIYVTGPGKARQIPTFGNGSMNRSNPEKFVDNCA